MIDKEELEVLVEKKLKELLEVRADNEFKPLLKHRFLLETPSLKPFLVQSASWETGFSCGGHQDANSTQLEIYAILTKDFSLNHLQNKRETLTLWYLDEMGVKVQQVRFARAELSSCSTSCDYSSSDIAVARLVFNVEYIEYIEVNNA